MSLLHPTAVPAWFRVHPDAQANAENYAAVRLAAVVVPPVFALVALVLALTFGGHYGDPASPATPVAVCDTDASCAAHDAAVAADRGVTLHVDATRPGMTPLVDITPDGGLRLSCGAEGTAPVDYPDGVTCLPIRGA